MWQERAHGGGSNAPQKNWPTGMDARSNFKAGIAYDDLREWLALADGLGEVRAVRGASGQEDIGLAAEVILRAEGVPCEKQAAGDMTHSVAVINACKPYHWRNKFPPSNAPSAEIARKARERFGWLLDGASET
jgi:hypothetical protein